MFFTYALLMMMGYYILKTIREPLLLTGMSAEVKSYAYAGLPPGLPLHSNRQRLYRGFCHPGLDWDALFRKFRANRMQVFELIESLPSLSERARRTSLKYMKYFYKILDSPKKRQEMIVGACRRPGG